MDESTHEKDIISKYMLAWSAAAVMLIVIPFVPTITWHTGSFVHGSRETISFASALLMHISHQHDHHEGMLLFVLPTLSAALSFLVPLYRRPLRFKIGVATLAIGLWEMFLVLVPARGYGAPYYVVAHWFGIQSMIPEDNYLAHAITLTVGGAVMVAIEVALRRRLDD